MCVGLFVSPTLSIPKSLHSWLVFQSNNRQGDGENKAQHMFKIGSTIDGIICFITFYWVIFTLSIILLLNMIMKTIKTLNLSVQDLIVFIVNVEFYSLGCCSGVVWARKHRWWAQAYLCIFSAWYPGRECGCRTLAHRLYFCWWWCLCVWWESIWPVGNWHRSCRGTFWICFMYKNPLSKYVTDSKKHVTVQ